MDFVWGSVRCTYRLVEEPLMHLRIVMGEWRCLLPPFKNMCIECCTSTHVIVHTNLQIKELRNHGDDVARELSLHGMSSDAVPNGRRGFEELLKLVRVTTTSQNGVVCVCVCVCVGGG